MSVPIDNNIIEKTRNLKTNILSVIEEDFGMIEKETDKLINKISGGHRLYKIQKKKMANCYCH